MFIQHKDGITAIPYPYATPNSERSCSNVYYVALSMNASLSSLDLSDAVNSFIDNLRV